jgi:hypothetical protein
MIYRLARLLQFSALIVLPVAIAGEVAGELSLKSSLMISTTGALLFLLGWWLQQGSRPR